MKMGGILLALAIGIILGFWGVFVSVFSDGSISERLVTIGIVLLIYLGLGAAWAFVRPQWFWIWVGILGLPGVIFLGMYTWREFSFYYVIYMFLILVTLSLGAWAGARLKRQVN